MATHRRHRRQAYEPRGTLRPGCFGSPDTAATTTLLTLTTTNTRFSILLTVNTLNPDTIIAKMEHGPSTLITMIDLAHLQLRIAMLYGD